MNPMNLMKLKPLIEQLGKNHPDLVEFGKSLYPDAVKPDTLVALYVATPEGQTHDCSVKLSASDVDTINQLVALFK